MTGLLVSILVLAAGSLFGWAILPSSAPAFASPLLFHTSCTCLLASAVLAAVSRSRLFRKWRAMRNDRRETKARAMAGIGISIERAAMMVRSIVDDARTRAPSAQEPIAHYESNVRSTVETVYAEAKRNGFRSDGVEKLLGCAMSVDDLERLTTALHRLSQEISAYRRDG